MNITDIANEYGTPAYAYDLQALGHAYDDLRAALPEPSTIYYSLKANPHQTLVSELVRRGCHAEVTSQGEIKATQQAGVDPARILMTGPAKTEDVISHALYAGVRKFSVDSPLDVSRLAKVAAEKGRPVNCLLRVNADAGVSGMGLSMTGTASQFGADESWITNDPRQFFGSSYTRITGLHLYMGTNLPDEETLLRQFEVAADVASDLMSVLGGLSEIDLGGGFGAPYAKEGVRQRYPHMAEKLAKLFDDKLPGWRDGAPRISFESGRYLVGDCGTLVSQVVDQKTSKGKTFTILDTGINHLGGMAGLRRLPPLVPTVQLPDRTPDETATGPGILGPEDAGSEDLEAPDSEPWPGESEEASKVVNTSVVGPLCTPLDSFARSVDLPPIDVGQYVTIPNVGAYGLTASLLAFLGHPSPVEVVYDADRIVTVTQLQIDRFEVATPTEARTNS